MAQKLTLIDDIDGSVIEGGNGGTVVFSVAGQYYSIDLSDANTQLLKDALAPFIAKARKTAPVGVSTSSRKAKTSGEDVAAIREWARENGIEVSARGRIPESVRKAFAEAN
ncbi:MAG TPA: Lsr2 family protein [Pseudoclavibacter sp.]|nr:Lsr2 family protein [Pseudoclavibacter sp.]